MIADSRADAVSCGDRNSAEAFVNETLQGIREGSESVDVDHFALLLRIRDILRYPSQRSVIIDATGPDLDIDQYYSERMQDEVTYSALFIDEHGM